MRNSIICLAVLLLAACSSGDVGGDSDEAEIQNAAKALEDSANAQANRMIAEIEASAPKEAAKATVAGEQKED